MNTHKHVMQQRIFVVLMCACALLFFAAELRAQVVLDDESVSDASQMSIEDVVSESVASDDSSPSVVSDEFSSIEGSSYSSDDAQSVSSSSSSSAASEYRSDAVTSDESSSIESSSHSSEDASTVSSSSSSSAASEYRSDAASSEESSSIEESSYSSDDAQFVSSSSLSSAASVASIVANVATDAARGEPSNVAPAFIIRRTATLSEANDVHERIEVTMTDIHGREQPVDVHVSDERDGYRVAVIPPSVIRSGIYRLRAVMHAARGSARRGEETADQFIVDQDVPWGMIAVNADRSHYGIGDRATLTIAPLQQTSTPACVETLSMAVDGGEYDKQPSCDGEIRTEMLASEDHSAFVVRAGISNLSWSVADVLPIHARASMLDVRRVSPSSVVLGKKATMNIIVRAENGFRGRVIETVPPGFVVSDVQPSASVDDRGDAGTVIEWSGEWQPGVLRTLRYTYTAPSDAPIMGLFGPLQARGVMIESELGAPSSSEEQQYSAASESSDASQSSGDGLSSHSSFSDSSSPASVDDQSSGASSSNSQEPASEESYSSDEMIDIPVDVQPSSDESWLGSVLPRITASLFIEEETVLFDEDRAMQVLVVTSTDTTELTSSLLELTPLKDHFEAQESATFRLLSNVSPETMLDGSLSEESALTTLVDQLSNADDIRTAVLSVVIEEAGSDIAGTLSRDSMNANEIRRVLDDDASPVRRLTTTVSTSVERAFASDDDLSDRIAGIVADDAAVQTVVNTLVTDDVREEIAHEVAKGNDIADVVSDIVRDQAKDLPSVVARTINDTPAAVRAVADSVASSDVSPAPAEVPIVQVSLRDRFGKTFTPSYHFKKGSLLLVLDPIPAFTPGLYTLEVTVTNPLSGESNTLEQDFAWGVLAINPDADVYEPGQKATLDIGVLDDLGEIVCSADLVLTITAPDGTVQRRATADDSIETTDTCGTKETGFRLPDYRTDVTLFQEGEYVLHLTAVTQAGERSMTTIIPVRLSPPFRITRTAATRLWPIGPSGMDITVSFSVDVSGSVIDRLPPGFHITSVDPPADVTVDTDETVRVRWVGGWKAGEAVRFTYHYDAPDISPQFYVIGPLQIRSETPLPTVQ